MDVRGQVREFLTTRRARVTPDRVGLPSGGGRRVPGLRRGEVAELAGISVEYYAKLERGQIAGASDAVLAGVADALLLDEAERVHLHDLVRAAGASSSRHSRSSRARQAARVPVRAGVQRILDAFTDQVAFVRDDVQNIVGINALGRAFYAPLYSGLPEGGVANLARFQFLDPASRVFYPQWQAMARMCVSTMRLAVGRTPDTEALQRLVGELTTQSAEFRRLWAVHDVRIHGHGVKVFDHPEVGRLDLAYEELAITAEPGLAVYVYSAEPGSAAHDKLRLLGALAAEHATDQKHPDDELPGNGVNSAQPTVDTRADVHIHDHRGEEF